MKNKIIIMLVMALIMTCIFTIAASADTVREDGSIVGDDGTITLPRVSIEEDKNEPSGTLESETPELDENTDEDIPSASDFEIYIKDGLKNLWAEFKGWFIGLLSMLGISGAALLTLIFKAISNGAEKLKIKKEYQDKIAEYEKKTAESFQAALKRVEDIVENMTTRINARLDTSDAEKQREIQERTVELKSTIEEVKKSLQA